MRDPNRLAELARSANAYTKDQLQPVSIPRRDSIATSPVDQHDARESLVLQRTGSVYYKDPLKSKRNVFKSKKEKAALTNTENWTYTKAERYAVLDQQVRKGGAAGLAQAILAFNPQEPLDVDVSYVADESGNAICTGKPNGRLDLIAARNERGDVAYIRLLAEYGASQASKDGALKVALDRKAMEATQELFMNGADPNANGCPEHFFSAIKEQNRRVYDMFLTAIVPMNPHYLNQALVEAVGKDSDLVALLIAHGADGMLNGSLALCAAIAGRNLQDTAMILINPESDLSPANLQLATNTARLLHKGISGKGLHIALQTAAGNTDQDKDYRLIEELMKYHASVDFFDQNGNCVCTAAAQKDEKALDLLCQGDPSPDTVAAALGYLPVSFATAEAGQYEQEVGMITTLLKKGARGNSVAELLIKAARDDHRGKALTILIQYKADGNYKDGKSIEEALRLPGISALEMICNGCRLEQNTFTIQLPNALKPRGFSIDKASLLARTSKSYNYKGIFDNPLVAEVEINGSRHEVIVLLLGLGASVDFQHGRALQQAVRTENIEVTNLLLGAGVEKPNIALAFPETSDIADRPTRYALMQALLKAGKSSIIGQDQALIQAAHEAIQYDLSHVELLLEHKASPNFLDGAAVIGSLQTRNLPLLQRFVQVKLNKKTLSNALTLAREIDCKGDERYEIFETILKVYSDTKQVSMALIETVQRDVNDSKTSFLLLNHGASLEPQNGLAIQIVASAGSLELLNLFLSTKPNQICRDAGYHAATSSPLSSEQRLPIYQSLLETGISQDLISVALIQATQGETIDHNLLAQLIHFKASLDFDDGSALHRVVTRGDLSTLIVLLQAVISQKQTLGKAFSAAMLASTGSNRLALAKALLEKEPGVSEEAVSHHLAQIVRENDHDLLSLMMAYQPSPEDNGGESLILSARAGDAKATELLTRAEVHSNIINQAFEHLLIARAIQLKPDGLETAKILLSKGVSQELIDRALFDGFHDPITKLTADLLELLIPYKPNVSGGEGKFFVDTAGTEHLVLFRRLASQKPDLNIVVPILIESIKNEEELIALLVHLEECAERGDVLLQDFVIFAALYRFPEGVLLAKHLLSHGCAANSKTESQLDSVTEKEIVTLLMFTLDPAPPMPVVSEEVVMEILADGHEAEISFESPVTQLSAGILASREGRNAVLRRLIELKVDLSHRDKNGRTALFYASRNGHLETAEILIQAGANSDDGSLHEAAREARSNIIELLLINGHRVDFPSAIHADGFFGRTALEELCLNATPGGDDWQKRIHKSIELLLPKSIKGITQSGGKTMLHLALENERSLDVTQELLAFPAVWENVNHSIHLFRDEQGYTYSPTKYVDLLFGASNPEKSQTLITLLRARKCKDRFYAHTVDQPEGAVGLPDEVLEAVNKQKRADHEQKEELKRRNAIAAHQRALEAEDYERNLKLAKERHSLLMKQLKEQEKTETQVAQSKHTLSVRHTQELQREKQEAIAKEAKMRLAAVNEEGARRRAVVENEQALELSHQRQLEARETSALKSKLQIEQQLINARDTASRAEYNRQVALCERQEQSAKYQAQQRSVAAYN